MFRLLFALGGRGGEGEWGGIGRGKMERGEGGVEGRFLWRFCCVFVRT